MLHVFVLDGVLVCVCVSQIDLFHYANSALKKQNLIKMNSSFSLSVMLSPKGSGGLYDLYLSCILYSRCHLNNIFMISFIG